MKKLGSMKNLIGMIPGMGAMANQLKDVDLDNSAEIKKIKALVSSMTPKERENPDLLNNTRKRRIAVGLRAKSKTRRTDYLSSLKTLKKWQKNSLQKWYEGFYEPYESTKTKWGTISVNKWAFTKKPIFRHF